MTPQFASSELNQLLQLELAEGGYQSPEDALLAGLKTLRQSRERQNEWEDRLASFRDGLAVELDGDEALAKFLDAIDAEVDGELRSQVGLDA